MVHQFRQGITVKMPAGTDKRLEIGFARRLNIELVVINNQRDWDTPAELLQQRFKNTRMCQPANGYLDFFSGLSQCLFDNMGEVLEMDLHIWVNC